MANSKVNRILARIAKRGDESRASKRGRTPMLADEKRDHCVSVRLNVEELAILDAARGRMQRGEFMRVAAIGELPTIIPEINREAWAELARMAANLNQVAKAVNEGQTVECSALLKEVRNALIGVKNG